MKPIINITSAFQGYCSPIDLLNYEATIFIVFLKRPSNGKAFFLECDEFNLSLEFINNEFVLTRSGFMVSLPCNVDSILLTILWSPTYIELSVNGKQSRLDTPYIIPPASLTTYAKNNNFIPSYQFQSVREFREAVHEQISRIKNNIVKSGSYDMFWNIQGSKGKRVYEPRNEIYNHTPIQALLKDWADIHSVEVIPEAKNAAGNMDFCLIGSVDGVGNVPICVELKHAHAEDIEHGLKVQLPEYTTRQ